MSSFYYWVLIHRDTSMYSYHPRLVSELLIVGDYFTNINVMRLEQATLLWQQMSTNHKLGTPRPGLSLMIELFTKYTELLNLRNPLDTKYRIFQEAPKLGNYHV